MMKKLIVAFLLGLLVSCGGSHGDKVSHNPAPPSAERYFLTSWESVKGSPSHLPLITALTLENEGNISFITYAGLEADATDVETFRLTFLGPGTLFASVFENPFNFSDASLKFAVVLDNDVIMNYKLELYKVDGKLSGVENVKSENRTTLVYVTFTL